MGVRLPPPALPDRATKGGPRWPDATTTRSSFRRADEQAAARLQFRGAGQARRPECQGRDEGAPREARQQRSVSMRIRTALSGTAAATAAAFDGVGRSYYYRER